MRKKVAESEIKKKSKKLIKLMIETVIVMITIRIMKIENLEKTH